MRRRFAAIGIIVVLVIGIAAYATITYWQNYNSSISKCEREASVGDSEVGATVISGSLIVPPGSIQGNLTMTVLTSGCAPFAGLLITSVQPPLGGIVNQSFLRYDGIVISTAYPVPTGARQVSASIEASGALANQSYTMMVTVNYATSDPGFMSSSFTTVFTSQS